MDLISPLLGLLAGALSILSPCVLPLIPIVFASASSRHPAGPLVLGGGMALSFTAVGLFVALLGFSIGLDGDVFRLAGGILLATAGLVLLIPRLQSALAEAAGPLSNWASSRTHALDDRGPTGQFGLGLLLGLVWTPCVGPTLGAASLLASRGESIGAVAAVMIAFAIGASTALIFVALAWRGLSRGSHTKVRSASGGGKQILGIMLVTVGLLAISGLDKVVESALVAISPDWLTRLTTAF